jgi:hypothetical protein
VRVAVAAGAAAALAAALPAPAHAAPSWLTPNNVSGAGRDASAPRIAVDGDGNALAVWVRSNGTHAIVQAATRPAGGTWSSPENLSLAGQNAGSPDVGVSPGGNAVAVWSRFNGTYSVVQAATRPAGGSWSAARDLSSATWSARESRVAVDDSGDAVAVWSRFNGANWIVQSATRNAGEDWSRAQDLSGGGADARRARIAVASGHAAALWLRGDPLRPVVQVVTRRAGGDWSLPHDVSEDAGRATENAEVGIDTMGNATAIWQRWTEDSHSVVQAATRSFGNWGAARDLTSARAFATEPHVAYDADGAAVAIWMRSEGTAPVTVETRTRPRGLGAAWASAQTVSAAEDYVWTPRIAFTRERAAVAVWVAKRGGSGEQGYVRAATRPPGGAWGRTASISARGLEVAAPQVAVDGDGNAVAVWERSDGANTIVQSAGYDAAGPHLRSLEVPLAGTVGRPLSMSVAPQDAWSPVGWIAWDYGDGTGGLGAAVSHAYAAPGRYTVAVVASDALGNPTTQRRTVEITAPTPTPTQTPTPPPVATPSPVPTASPAPTTPVGPATPAGPARPTPSKWVTLTIERTLPLPRPSGLQRATVCRGRVEVSIKHARTRVARKTVGVGRECAYRVSFRILRDRLEGAQWVTVNARFLGNQHVNPRATPSFRVHIPA